MLPAAKAVLVGSCVRVAAKHSIHRLVKRWKRTESLMADDEHPGAGDHNPSHDELLNWCSPVDRWDFHWLDAYDFREPVALPKGARINMPAHFDHSAEDPADLSNPPVEVSWGKQTTNELSNGFLHRTRGDEHPANRPPKGTAQPLR
jgi:hypothetical protein